MVIKYITVESIYLFVSNDIQSVQLCNVCNKVFMKRIIIRNYIYYNIY